MSQSQSHISILRYYLSLEIKSDYILILKIYLRFVLNKQII